jgi:hypothetical protein
MEVYVVEVIPEGGFGKVSQEGYRTLKQAQAFIESRSDNPQKLTEYLYRSYDYTDYLIYLVTIV